MGSGWWCDGMQGWSGGIISNIVLYTTMLIIKLNAIIVSVTINGPRILRHALPKMITGEAR
jgi:hypothetical protein